MKLTIFEEAVCAAETLKTTHKSKALPGKESPYLEPAKHLFDRQVQF